MAMGQTLYPRVDDASRADFKAAGSEPFTYQKKDRAVAALAERWPALDFSAVAERWWNGAEESRADRA
jgi:TfoX/Sxy family transcriptional regulator of competence genes